MKQLYINVGGRPLELNPGTVMELEEENPFLQLNDQLKGDYSLPIEVPLTDANKPIFHHLQLLPASGKIATVDNVVVGDGLEQMVGILRKEQLTGNLNHIGTDKLSLYFLKGWSHFYKDVQNKKLYNVDYGGDRSFAINYNDYFNNDFHSHILDVINNGTIDKYDYALYTVYNSASTTGDIFNNGNTNTLNNFLYYADFNRLDFNPGSKISFFPYLNYVLKQLFNTFGWTVDGYIFTEPSFKKATVINTAFLDYTADAGNVQKFNLRDFVPSVNISTFLIGLSNRFGWWYDFDYLRKRCTIRTLNDVLTLNAGWISVTR
jgi:hypothetical protein